MAFIPKNEKYPTYLTTWIKRLYGQGVPRSEGENPVSFEVLLETVDRRQAHSTADLVKHLSAPRLKKIIDLLQRVEKEYAIKETGNPEILWQEWHGYADELWKTHGRTMDIRKALDGEVGEDAVEKQGNALHALRTCYLRMSMEEVQKKWSKTVDLTWLESAEKGRRSSSVKEVREYLECVKTLLHSLCKTSQDAKIKPFLLGELEKDEKKLLRLCGEIEAVLHPQKRPAEEIKKAIAEGPLHEKLIAIREHLGWSADEAAVAMGVSDFAYRGYESGAHTPKPQSMQTFIKAIGNKPDDRGILKTAQEELQLWPVKEVLAKGENDQLLYALRYCMGWSAKEAGSAAGVSESTFKAYETNLRPPSKKAIDVFVAAIRASEKASILDNAVSVLERHFTEQRWR